MVIKVSACCHRCQCVSANVGECRRHGARRPVEWFRWLYRRHAPNPTTLGWNLTYTHLFIICPCFHYFVVLVRGVSYPMIITCATFVAFSHFMVLGDGWLLIYFWLYVWNSFPFVYNWAKITGWMMYGNRCLLFFKWSAKIFFVISILKSILLNIDNSCHQYLWCFALNLGQKVVGELASS